MARQAILYLVQSRHVAVVRTKRLGNRPHPCGIVDQVAKNAAEQAGACQVVPVRSQRCRFERQASRHVLFHSRRPLGLEAGASLAEIVQACKRRDPRKHTIGLQAETLRNPSTRAVGFPGKYRFRHRRYIQHVAN